MHRYNGTIKSYTNMDKNISLYEIADFWNESTKNGQEPDMDKLNAMIEEGGYVNDCHEQWGICHSDKGKVVLQDDMTAYVLND